MRKLFAVLAVPVIVLFWGVSAASALTISRTGSSGTVNDSSWTWSTTQLSNINETIADTACDNHAAYGYFIVYSTNVANWTTPGRYDKQGCNTSVTWNGLYINNMQTLVGVRFVVCTDGVACVDHYFDNPKT